MARIPLIDPLTINDGLISEHLAAASETGTPEPEMYAMLAHRPSLLRNWGTMWRDLFSDGVLPTRLKELCRLRITAMLDCGYCSGQRSQEAIDEGLTEDEISCAIDFDAAVDNPREAVALDFARVFVAQAGDLDASEFKEYSKEFTDEELVELGAFCAFCLGFAHMVHAFDLQRGELARLRRA